MFKCYQPCADGILCCRVVKIVLAAPLMHQVKLIKSIGRRGDQQVIKCKVVQTAKQTVTLPQRQAVRQAIMQPFRRGELITEGFPVQESRTERLERSVSKRLSSCGLQGTGFLQSCDNDVLKLLSSHQRMRAS